MTTYTHRVDNSLNGYIKFIIDSFSNWEIIFVLCSRHLKTRYRRSFLGVFWSLLNPLLVTLVLWFVFVQVFSGRFEMPISYASYVLSGTLFVTLIQGTLPQIGDSITATGSISAKARVNPLSLIYSVSLSGITSLCFGLVPLCIYSFLKGSLSAQVFLLLPWMIITFFLLVSLGIWIAIAYSIFNDLQNIIAVLLILTSYVTPIFYPITMLKGITRKIVEFNPLTVCLEIFRISTVSYGKIGVTSLVFLISFILINFVVSTRILFTRWPKMVNKL